MRAHFTKGEEFSSKVFRPDIGLAEMNELTIVEGFDNSNAIIDSPASDDNSIIADVEQLTMDCDIVGIPEQRQSTVDVRRKFAIVTVDEIAELVEEDEDF